MPQDSIRDWVMSEESMYSKVQELFDDWMAQGDAWSEKDARRAAKAQAREFATQIESFEFTEGSYTNREVQKAANEMLEDFDEHREATITEITERLREAVPRKPMTAGDREHAAKYETMAQDVGIDALSELIPATPKRIREALRIGDEHLNTIPLRHWDAATLRIPVKGLSLAEKVSLLKHVATWHYA